MSSYVKLSAKVIGVVAVGASVVAIGWLGWKAYSKVSGKTLQADGSTPAAVDEVNMVPPGDEERVLEAAVGDLDLGPNCPPRRKRNASYLRRLARRTKEREEGAAREQQATPVVQDPCAADAVVDPVVVVIEEDASPSADEMDDSVKEGALPEPVADPACTEHPVTVTRHELVEDVRACEGEQLVDGIADAVADAPVRVGKKRNAAYQRRLAKRANERAERAAREQQATPAEASVLPVVEAEASVVVDHVPDATVEAELPESACDLAAEEQDPIPIRHECVVDVVPVQDERLVDGTAVEVPVAPVRVGQYRKPQKALWNASYQRRLARRAKEREERAAREQQATPVVQDPCAADAIVEPVVVVVEEEASLSANQMDDSVKEDALPEPVADPVCTEHTVTVTRHELVEDVRSCEGEQLVDGIADAVADAPVRVGKKRNASYHRRLAKRAKEREERAALEQAVVGE